MLVVKIGEVCGAMLSQFASFVLPCSHSDTKARSDATLSARVGKSLRARIRLLYETKSVGSLARVQPQSCFCRPLGAITLLTEEDIEVSVEAQKMLFL